MTRRSFYDDINRRAKAEFGREKIDAAVKEAVSGGPLWKEWEACWWKHANALVAELYEAGLPVSAASLENSLRSSHKAKEYMNGYVS